MQCLPVGLSPLPQRDRGRYRSGGEQLLLIVRGGWESRNKEIVLSSVRRMTASCVVAQEYNQVSAISV